MSATLKEFNAKNGLLAGTRSANYLQVLGAATGNAVAINALGTDTNINITLAPKGTGSVNLANSVLTGTLTVGGSVGTSGQILQSTGTGIQWAAAPSSLPTQTGSSGKFLTTDGTSASWATVSTGSNGILTNTSTVTTSQSLGAGTNALSVGPITVANGVSVTVASGNRWVVI